MRVEFSGSFKNNKVYQQGGLFLNDITVLRNDGEEVILDRDETEYTYYENGKAEILFKDTYEYNPDTGECRYLVEDDMPLYDKAILLDAETEDDAPEWYDLKFEKQTIACW